eukprot:g2788.t1
MTTILKNTHAVHEARDAAYDEMTKLKSRSEKNQSCFEKEWADLTEIINQDRQAQESKRIEEMEEREKKTQELLRSTQDNEEMRRKLRKSGWQTEKRLQARSEAMQEVQKYELAFEQIRDATGINEMDEVIEQVAEMEDENYTLFNYIQELDKDIEALTRKIRNTERSFNKDSENLNSVPTFNQDSKDTVEAGLDQEGDQISKEDCHQVHSVIIDGLSSLLKSIKGDSVKTEEITVDTIGVHLGQLETLITDSFKDVIDFSEGEDLNSEQFNLLLGPNHFSIMPPSTHLEDADGIGLDQFDDERPCLGTELKSVVANIMKQRTLSGTT